DLNPFLKYTILQFSEQLRPLIERMVTSQIGEVASKGALWATVAWVHRGLMDDIASACVKGTWWQRKGVATAVSDAIAHGYGSPAVEGRLRSLFDDPEKVVRDAASDVFSGADFLQLLSAVPLAEAFLQSRALNDNVHDLLQCLEGFTRSLKPYGKVICGLADHFAGPLAAEARDFRTHRPLEADLLAKVLLRLYEQSEHDRALRQRCLDTWDALLSQRVGFDVLASIDA
ncbi:MAG: hypothetical protein U0835_27705, partial [Isosphaeraceae bacterium]